MSDIKCINLTVIAPKDKVEELEKIFCKHGDWMNSFYADDKEHLLHGYFTKAPEYEVIHLILIQVKREVSFLLLMNHCLQWKVLRGMKTMHKKMIIFLNMESIGELNGKGLNIGGELTYSF